MNTSDNFVRGGDAQWEDVAPGVSRQMLGYQPAAMMVRVKFAKGAIGAKHRHPHIQCSLVESGVFDVMIGGRTERLAVGDAFVIPANVEHGVVAVEAGVLVDVFTPMREDFLGLA